MVNELVESLVCHYEKQSNAIISISLVVMYLALNIDFSLNISQQYRPKNRMVISADNDMLTNVSCVHLYNLPIAKIVLW